MPTEKIFPLQSTGSGQSCPSLLVEALQSRAGIKAIRLHPENHQLVLEYDPEEISPEQLEEIAHQLGGQVSTTWQECLMRRQGTPCEDCPEIAAEKERRPRRFLWKKDRDSDGLRIEKPDKGTNLREFVVTTGRLRSTEEADFEPGWLGQTLLLAGCALLIFVGWIVFALEGPDWIFFALATLPVGIPTFWATLRSLWSGKLDVDFLMLLGAIGASIIGHFHEAAILLFLFVLSSLLESFALGRTRQALRSLMTLRPDKANVKRNGATRAVPLENIAIGETLVVGPGERIPLDGTVAEGEADVDESALTGESLPCWKGKGSSVLAGSINLTGALHITTTRLAGESTLARIVQLVESARASKAPTQRLLDRFVVFYVATVLVAATLTAVVPPLSGWQSWSEMFYRAMTLLVVASPCALVISTPATILSAIAAAARRGILFKGGVVVEALGKADTIAFDKTGTLTLGRLAVVSVRGLDGWTENEVLSLAAAAESSSEHPLAQAIVQEARARQLKIPEATHFQTTAGLGVEATVENRSILIGSSRFLQSRNIDLSSCSEMTETGLKVIRMAVEGELVGKLSLADQLRPETQESIKELRRLAITNIIMLTGDDQATAQNMAEKAGISEYRAGLLPDEKVTEIHKLVGNSQGIVMVGDGVNDAPALAAADVGVAMGASGTDLAIESADVVLMSSDLGKLVEAISLSGWARRILFQNLFFASGMVVALVLLALVGLLPMSVGVVGHEGSTLLVVLNGLRLLGFSPKG